MVSAEGIFDHQKICSEVMYSLQNGERLLFGCCVVLLCLIERRVPPLDFWEWVSHRYLNASVVSVNAFSKFGNAKLTLCYLGF